MTTTSARSEQSKRTGASLRTWSADLTSTSQSAATGLKWANVDGDCRINFHGVYHSGESPKAMLEDQGRTANLRCLLTEYQMFQTPARDHTGGTLSIDPFVLDHGGNNSCLSKDMY